MPNMRAIQIDDYEETALLKAVTIPRPVPAAGEVLLKIEYAGVNPIDWKLRSGLYRKYMPLAFPWRPGIDAAGTIAELGPGVSGLSLGQRVFGIAKGSYAELAIANAIEVAPLPAGLDAKAAATLPVGSLTGWKMVEDAALESGRKVLVQGAAGGVGLFAAQFAKLKGALVWGTASTGNLAFVKTLGVEALDYSKNQLEGKEGFFDVVLDTVGGPTQEASWKLLRKGGVLVTVVGQASQETAASHGVIARTSGRGSAESLATIAGLVASGRVKTEVGRIFPLEEAAAAHELVQKGHGRGRVLLKV
jgi:NADPH:quinone reductase-like Zn-dependent oxidoreductase